MKSFKKSLLKPSPYDRVYPYLLRGRKLREINEVWSADITCIRMKHGFLYLVAIMDWISPFVLLWELSTTLEAVFYIRVLKGAPVIRTPKIFNSDQGC